MFLDLLRLAACQMVVLGHAIDYFNPGLWGSVELYGRVLAGAGLTLFFVISGLLISNSLLYKAERASYGFKNYFIDRFARIYSGLIPCLALVMVVDVMIYLTSVVSYADLAIEYGVPTVENLFLNLLMLETFSTQSVSLSNLLAGVSIPVFGFNAPLWSLVIEWWLYMFFGWIVLGYLRRGKASRPLFFIGLVVFSAILICFSYNTITLMIIWFLGVGITLFLNWGWFVEWTSSGRHVLLLYAMLISGVAFTFYQAYRELTTTQRWVGVELTAGLVAIVLSVILLFNRKPIGKEGRLSRLVKIGSGYSYTLYLIHFPIMLWLNILAPSTDKLFAVVMLVMVTNIVALVIAIPTEMRHREFGRWLKNRLSILD